MVSGIYLGSWSISPVDNGATVQKVLPFATAGMGLENTVLSEISQSEKDEYHMLSLICGI